MSKTVRIVLVILAIFSLGGCASVIHGTTQKIPVVSYPSGASVAIAGKTKEYKTPCDIELERETDHRLTISADGYEPEIVDIKHSVSAAVMGNAILGGLVGIIVDSSNGAVFKLTPDIVHAKLKPNSKMKSEEPQTPEVTGPPEPFYVAEIRSKGSISAKVRAAAELYNQSKITKEERDKLQASALRGEI